MRATTKLVATLAVFMAFAVPGMANTISIGLQEAGYGSPLGSITTEATGNGNAGVVGLIYGTFKINNITGTEGPGATLDSDSINVFSAKGGTLLVYVTETGVSIPSGPDSFFSSFTSNVLPSGWTATLQTWFDQGDVAYQETTPLGSQMFSGIGISTATQGVTVAGPFSETEVFKITATGSGRDNLTIHLTAAEPTTAALLVVVMGAGLLLRKRFASA